MTRGQMYHFACVYLQYAIFRGSFRDMASKTTYYIEPLGEKANINNFVSS